MRTIRTAKASEAGILSDLAFRSKAHWDYSKEFMAKCKNDLKIKSTDLTSRLTRVIIDGDIILGFYSLYGEDQDGKLTDLFVEPHYIGKGVGKELWNAAVNQAQKLGFKSLEIHADPNAEDFYLHMGAERIGSVSSDSISGRELPLLMMRI